MSKESEEIRQHAMDMLLKTFGDMDTALTFARQHGIVPTKGGNDEH